MMLARKVGVLFVCMGNICRSPTAEGVFRVAAERAGLARSMHIDSAGTHDYHVGEPPDARAIASALRRGYDLRKHRARQISPRDFERYDWILAMDRHNLQELGSQRPNNYAGHLGLLLDFVPSLAPREVPDPYYGGSDGFERVLDLVEHAADPLLQHVTAAAGNR